MTIAEYERLFKLSPWWRLALSVVGLAFFISGFYFFISPPNRTTTEFGDDSHTPTTTTNTSADPSATVIALLAGGIAFIAYAATGYKFTKIEAFGVKGETPPPPGANEDSPIKPKGLQPPPVEGAPEPPSAPQPAAPPHSTIATHPVPPPPDPTPAATTRPAYLPQPTDSPPISPIRPFPRESKSDPRITALRTKYPFLQFGSDPIDTFLLRSSWNGLKILKSCQVAAQKQRVLKLRDFALVGSAMSYDYAFGYFIASFSAGAFIGMANPATGHAWVYEVDPTLSAKIDEILEGNIQYAPNADVAEAKRRDLASLHAFLNTM